MASRYWVGGTAAWDGTAGTKWALTSGGAGGQAIPTTSDDVFFDGASGVVTCTISTVIANAKSINCTGFTGTLAGTAPISVAGSITLVAGMTFSYTGTITITATATITSASKTFSNVTINGTGITVTLAAALTINSINNTTLTAGTLDLAGFTLSAGLFSSNNSNTRAIAFGTGNIALTGTTFTTVLDIATATGFTFTGTGGFTRNMAAAATVTFGTTGGTTANAPNLTVNTGASSLTITTGSFFKNVNFTGSTTLVVANPLNMAGNLTLASGGVYTSLSPTFRASATVTSAGRTIGSPTVNGTGITVTLADALTAGSANTTTLTAGTLNLAGFTLTTGIFSSSNSNTRAIAFGTSNISLPSASVSVTVLDITNATNFTWTGTGGFTRNQVAIATLVFGTTGGTTSNAPNLTVNAGASTLTITSNSWFKEVNFTGSTCTVTQSGPILNMAGNLTLASGGTYTSLTPTFLASATLTSAGRTIGSTIVNGTGITVTLADALTTNITSTTTLTAGTLDLAGFTLSTGSFSSSNSNTRAIAFGTSNIALTSVTSSQLVLNITTATNFTWTGTTGGFTRNQAATANITVGSTGGTTANAPNLTVNAGASALISIGGYFKNLNFTGSTCTVTGPFINMAGDLTLASGGTYTSLSPTFLVSATVTSAGQTIGQFGVSGTGITVTLADALTTGITNTTTLTEGTLNLAGFTLSTGIFNSNNSNTRAIAFGSGNIGLTSISYNFTVLAIQTATNFTWTGTGGFTRNAANTGVTNFGGTAGGSASNAPNLTFNAGTVISSIGGYFKNIDFTGSAFSISGACFVCGNVTLSTGGTFTLFSPTFIANASLTSLTKTIASTWVDGVGITVTLADNFSANSLSLTNGTFTAANFDVSIGSLIASNSNTRTLNMGSGTWTLSNSGAFVWNTSNTTGLTLNPSTSTVTMTSASAKTFAGGGLTYHNLNQGGAGALTISGSNTFNDITNTVQPATVTFTAGTTQTVSNFGLSGTAGNLITINSSTPGTQATLSKASGTVNGQHLSIQDSNATGGAVWNALNSTNLGNNTGWIISGGSNMFLMFN